MPPLMPPAKLRPVGPTTSPRPPPPPPLRSPPPWAPAPPPGRVRAAVAAGEALARRAVEERLARGRAVQRDVAHDHVLLGHEAGPARRVDHEASAREPLAHVVVRVAFEREREPARDERAEALAGRALEHELDRVVGQACDTVASRDLAP